MEQLINATNEFFIDYSLQATFIAIGAVLVPFIVFYLAIKKNRDRKALYLGIYIIIEILLLGYGTLMVLSNVSAMKPLWFAQGVLIISGFLMSYTFQFRPQEQKEVVDNSKNNTNSEYSEPIEREYIDTSGELDWNADITEKAKSSNITQRKTYSEEENTEKLKALVKLVYDACGGGTSMATLKAISRQIALAKEERFTDKDDIAVLDGCLSKLKAEIIKAEI